MVFIVEGLFYSILGKFDMEYVGFSSSFSKSDSPYFQEVSMFEVLKMNVMDIDLRIIGTKDISLWKGVQLRSAQREMNRIRDYFDKASHQYITNEEVAEYYGIPVELFEAKTKLAPKS